MEYIVFFIFVALFVLFIFIKGSFDAHKKKKQFVRFLYENHGELPKKEYPSNKFEIISHYYKRHPREGQLDDITWNDLNMDEIFKRLNYTYTSAGEEYLYYTLRSPELDNEALKKKEALIQGFADNPDNRVKLQLLLSDLGYSGKYSIYDYLENLDILGNRSNIKHYIANFLFLPFIGVSLFDPSKGLILIGVLIIYNFVTYFKEKNEIDPYIISFAYIMRLLHMADKVCAMKNTIFEEEKAGLEKSKRSLSQFRRGSFWLMSSGRMSGSGNPLDILMDYLRMMFHLDLMKFNSMLSEVRKHIEDVDKMLEISGYLEAMIAIGSYRASLEKFCVPQIADTLTVKDAVHPLLEHAVANSIEVSKGVLLTGSNASGKSTFLKTIAANAVLAQTIHTCLAAEYTAPLYHIYSSMSLRDDIGQGDSYYIVEIKSMKRILDGSKQTEGHVLCFVDEVLRGTNTVERIAASTQILRSLTGKNVTCFAATHDIELTDLLEKDYDNYHFEEEVEENDVKFSYQLLPGKATTRNAIKLLQVMGYDSALIEDAEEMSKRFLKEGVWR